MIKIIYAALGTLGFGMLFNANKNKLLYIVLGGILNYIAYFITFEMTKSDFLASVFCAFIISCYAFVMSRLIKCPSSIFIITGLIPSVPGGTLFYTMQNLVMGDLALANKYGITTIEVILGIVSGMLLWSAVSSLILHFRPKNIIKK